MSTALRGDEIVSGQRIRCYDNEGETADRYTVVYMDAPSGNGPGMFHCLGMNDRPFHPQGIGQHSSAQVGKHLGKRIAFDSLPADCQRAVMQDIDSESSK